MKKKKEIKMFLSEKKNIDENFSDCSFTDIHPKIKISSKKEQTSKSKKHKKKKSNKKLKSKNNLVINNLSLKELNSEKTIFKNSKKKKIFDNIEFYIADNFSKERKNYLISKIENNNGKIVKNMLITTNFLISDKKDFRTISFVNNFKKNAFKSSYVDFCLENGFFCKKNLEDFILISF